MVGLFFSWLFPFTPHPCLFPLPLVPYPSLLTCDPLPLHPLLLIPCLLPLALHHLTHHFYILYFPKNLFFCLVYEKHNVFKLLFYCHRKSFSEPYCTLYSWDKNSVANASNIVFPHEKEKFRTFVPFSRITYFHSRVIFVFKNATTKTFAFHLCSAFSLCFFSHGILNIFLFLSPLFFPLQKYFSAKGKL